MSNVGYMIFPNFLAHMVTIVLHFQMLDENLVSCKQFVYRSRSCSNGIREALLYFSLDNCFPSCVVLEIPSSLLFADEILLFFSFFTTRINRCIQNMVLSLPFMLNLGTNFCFNVVELAAFQCPRTNHVRLLFDRPYGKNIYFLSFKKSSLQLLS